MKNRASSFPADAPRPWHRERWPWLIMAGPIAVVLACIASAWLAAKSDDGLVAQDYYKQGLLINQKLRRDAPEPAPVPGAGVSVSSDRGIHVRLADAGVPPQRLRLTFVRPGERTRSERVDLALSGDEWVGTLPELANGRWIVAMESERWQLPITVVVVPFTRLMLGSAAPHS